MKLYLAANDKKTAGEISDALGKTTKLAVSDSLSRDRDLMQRRSVSRRMEERPLLTPDEVRRLSPDQAILIPERQNPLLVRRIVYFLDPVFLKIFEAQAGPLPYPSQDSAKVQGLAERVDELERRIAGMKVVDFVRQAGVAVKPGSDRAESALARVLTEAQQGLSAREIKPISKDLRGRVMAARTIADSGNHIAGLKPDQTTAIARMTAFTRKVSDLPPGSSLAVM